MKRRYRWAALSGLFIAPLLELAWWLMCRRHWATMREPASMSASVDDLRRADL